MRFTILLMALLVVTIGRAQKKNTFVLDAGILTYGTFDEKIGYTFKGSYHKNVMPNLSIGVGTGYEQYTIYGDIIDDFKGVPIFIQGRYIVKPVAKKSFYGSVDVGYGFSFLNKDIVETWQKIERNGGILISPEIGVRFLTRNENLSWKLGVAYHYQAFNMKRYYNGWGGGSSGTFEGYDNFEDKDYTLNRLAIKVGFTF